MCDKSEKLINLWKSHFDFELTKNQVSLFVRFMEDVIEKNKVLNLTRIVEDEEFIVKHIIDSCQLFHVKHFGEIIDKSCNIIDVGTGAGFPGVPLAILLKDKPAKITLTDSLNKRIDFLKEEITKLGLTNVEAIHSRAEDLAHNHLYREKFDCAVSRGVAKINVLAEYLFPFVKEGGKVAFYKLSDIEEELNDGMNAIKILGGNNEYVKHKYKLYEDEPERAIFVYSKIKQSLGKYPRKAGIPSKEPLK